MKSYEWEIRKEMRNLGSESLTEDSELFCLSGLDTMTDAVNGLTGFSQAASGVFDVELDSGHLALVGKGLEDLLLKLRLEVFEAHFGHGTEFDKN